VTKMSHLHFATNAASAARLRQMGEDPARIVVSGSPGLDVLAELPRPPRGEAFDRIGLAPRRVNLMVTFHPATLDPRGAAAQQEELLAALDALGPEAGLVLTGSNADVEGRGLTARAAAFAAARPNAVYRASLGQRLYLQALGAVDAVLGNSSSGLHEAPSFGTPTVNIGDRQDGRPKAASVIDCRAGRHPAGAGDRLPRRGQPLRRRPRRRPDRRGAQGAGRSRPPAAQAVPPPDRSGRGGMSVFVIAEAGVNHNGSPERALALVDAAAAAGADAVKFQTFRAAALASAAAPKAAYQKAATGEAGSQLDMLRALELDADAHRSLLRRCDARGIQFLSTPFDHGSLALLLELGLPRLKIGSGDLTNAPLVHAAARSGRPLILSTGMADLAEVEAALGVAAVGRGAAVIEKHLTLDRGLPGPDHRASLEPSDFAMVAAIRTVERALGDGVKRPQPCEIANMAVARKSVVAARPVAAGRAFAAEDLAVKRPGGGLPPAMAWELVGRRAGRAYAADEPIDAGDAP